MTLAKLLNTIERKIQILDNAEIEMITDIWKNNCNDESIIIFNHLDSQYVEYMAEEISEVLCVNENCILDILKD